MERIVIIPALNPDEGLRNLVERNALFFTIMKIEQLGCKAAYNLDGGHCSFMTLQNQVANNPYKPEHRIEDGIFITEGL